MKKIRSNMPQKELIELARKGMYKVMLEKDHQENEYESEKTNYFYFSGLWHLKFGLVTSKIINDLQKEANLLSVGVGGGHLERLLVEVFDINRKNIDIADINLEDSIMNYGFDSYTFDMTKSWPTLNKSYNYIIFPESLGVAVMHNNLSSKLPNRYKESIRFFQTLNNVIDNELKYKKSSSESNIQLYKSVIEQDVTSVREYYQVISEAFRNLSENGEIRVEAGINSIQSHVYVALKLKELFPFIGHTREEGLSIFKNIIKKKGKA